MVCWFVIPLANSSYSLVIKSNYHFLCPGSESVNEYFSFFCRNVLQLLLAASYFIPHFTATFPYEICTLIFTHEIRMQQVTCLQNNVIAILACRGWSALTVTFQAETHVLYVELMVGVFVQCLPVLSPGRTDVATSFYKEYFLPIIEHFFSYGAAAKRGLWSHA